MSKRNSTSTTDNNAKITAAAAAGLLMVGGVSVAAQQPPPSTPVDSTATVRAAAPPPMALTSSTSSQAWNPLAAPEGPPSSEGDPAGSGAAGDTVLAVSAAVEDFTADANSVTSAGANFFAPLVFATPQGGAAGDGPSVPQALNTQALFGGGAFLGLIGPGGLLIGDGLDATCAGCPGGNGGLLWGNGGKGGDGVLVGGGDLGHPRLDQLDERRGQLRVPVPQPHPGASGDPAGVHLVVQQVPQIERIALGVLPKPLRAERIHRPGQHMLHQVRDFRQRKWLQFKAFQMLVFPDRGDRVRRRLARADRQDDGGQPSRDELVHGERRQVVE